MKCLNRIELQMFIDREIDPVLEDEILHHLDVCRSFSKMHLKMAEEIVLIHVALDSACKDIEEKPVPEFNPAIWNSRKRLFYRFIPVIAAASIICMIFLFRLDKVPVVVKIPQSEIIMYEFFDGKDLNKLWHDKSQIQIIQDEMGNVILTTITN